MRTTPAALIVALACAPFLATTPSVQAIIIGSREPCQNEGEAVAVDKIKDMSCFKCICKNGFVECDHGHCPDVRYCYMQMPKEGCCVKCKGCLYNGVMHNSDTEWTEPRDPCRILRCEAGVVTESVAQCYTPCEEPKPPLPGQCCSSCHGCHINGQRVPEGRDVTISEDPCLKCHCSKSKLSCVKRACPVLPCPVTVQITPPGECCPVCSEGKPAKIFPDSIPNKPCIIGKEYHLDGKSFTLDKCTKCSCMNGTIFCKRTSCPVLECNPLYQKTSVGECCPHCPPIEEAKSTCTVSGKTYEDNESWRLDECKACMCYAGEIRCAVVKCSALSCPAGQHPERPEGQCCARCVESESVCTVFGDPHYKTFDGKFFSFQGSCKYQLTADCVNYTFSIRITNDARSTPHSSWAKTVSLKLGNTKINLGKKLRVKVDSVRVELPHNVTDGVATIERKENYVVVNTSLGIKLMWDGNGFLEVAVPTSMKDNLCGLCGNYNSLVRDDFMMRNGAVLRNANRVDVWKFGESWRVGGKKACSRKNNPMVKHKPCNKLKRIANKTCKFFNKSDALASCRQKLNPDNYIEACVMDMCQCPTDTCYCDAFSAYARECQRIGAATKDWRKETGCGINKRVNRLHYLGGPKRQRHKPTLFPFSILAEEPFSRPPPGHARRPPPDIH